MFERRIQKQEKENSSNLIKPLELSDDGQNEPSNGQNRDSDDSEEFFYSSAFEPYQLKSKLRVQKVEEVQFDANDEETFILQ